MWDSNCLIWAQGETREFIKQLKQWRDDEATMSGRLVKPAHNRSRYDAAEVYEQLANITQDTISPNRWQM